MTHFWSIYLFTFDLARISVKLFLYYCEYRVYNIFNTLLLESTQNVRVRRCFVTAVRKKYLIQFYFILHSVYPETVKVLLVTWNNDFYAFVFWLFDAGRFLKWQFEKKQSMMYNVYAIAASSFSCFIALKSVNQ